MTYQFKTSGVCARFITVSVSDRGRIESVEFDGGCHGYRQAISSLVRGMRMSDVIGRLEGLDCAGRGTSCADQLARGLKLIEEERKSLPNKKRKGKQ